MFEVDAIVGVATAGIAHATLVAHCLELPMAYVRPKPKAHGLRKQIEGQLAKGSRVVVIEDLVSTGMSALRAVKVIQSHTGVLPLRVLSIVSYNLKGVASGFESAGVPLETLTTFDTLMQMALEFRHVRASDVDDLRAWQQDPQAWSIRRTG